MSIHNRERFLHNVARKLGRESWQNRIERPNWQYQPQHTVYKGLSENELVTILEEHCEDIHTHCRVTTKDQLNDTLADVLTQWEAQKIVTTGDPRFRQFGVDQYLQKEKEAGKWQVHVWDPSLGDGNILPTKEADVGITFSDYTLAESATIVLLSEGEKGTSVSLLPTMYVAIIPQSTIVPRFTQAAQAIHQRIQHGDRIASCINFITGPSNSADIEMDLVVGVHGPIQATYIVVTDI